MVAAACALAARVLRQPLMVAYMAAGVIVGSSVLALAKSSDVFEVLSQIGIAFLLFTIGLGMNWRRVREVGAVSIASGLGQIFFTSMVGFALCQWLGLDALTSIFVSVAFSFSSTIIIVKLLSDKDDTDTLYGRISVGFLLVQDLVAMFILLALGSLRPGVAVGDIVVGTFFKGAAVVVILVLLSTFIVPRLVRFAAVQQELLLLFALGWCFAVAGLLVYFGFGVEMGALAAGLSLSGTRYQRELQARVRPLRDFFLVLFFVVLGTRLPLGEVAGLVVPIVVLSVFVLVGNPFIMLLVMRALGYHPKTSFLVGTTVAQVSEFSFIMLAAGLAVGYVHPSALVLATSVGLITIAGSTYLVKYNEELYERFRPLLRWLEKDKHFHEKRTENHAGPRAILFGYDRTGRVVLPELRRLFGICLVVDYDPETIDLLMGQEVSAVYGDAGDAAFLEDLRTERAKIVVSTIPDALVSLELLAYLRSREYVGISLVTVRTPEEAESCYEAGADYVLVPHRLGAQKFLELLHENRTGRRQWKKTRMVDCVCPTTVA